MTAQPRSKFHVGQRVWIYDRTDEDDVRVIQEARFVADQWRYRVSGTWQSDSRSYIHNSYPESGLLSEPEFWQDKIDGLREDIEEFSLRKADAEEELAKVKLDEPRPPAKFKIGEYVYPRGSDDGFVVDRASYNYSHGEWEYFSEYGHIRPERALRSRREYLSKMVSDLEEDLAMYRAELDKMDERE